MSSESAHHLTVGALKFAVRIPFVGAIVRRSFGDRSPGLTRNVMGLQFPNPLGIAAGFDKNGTAVEALAALGFGCIEIGSVTPRPQSGNPKPRLFRLKKSRALINRMGFNNDGCEKVAQRLSRLQHRNYVLGANIGKNKDTPNEAAVRDYLTCFHALHAHVDYFVVNVSSPNTPGLRALQDRGPLTEILKALINANHIFDKQRPILLKIAPDLTETQLDEIAALAREVKLDGLIISNTTVSRDGLREDRQVLEKIGPGGLSGAPLTDRALEVLRYMRDRLPKGFVLVGVGGINTAEQARARMSSGADLIQVYTGLIYEGPGLIRKILRALI